MKNVKTNSSNLDRKAIAKEVSGRREELALKRSEIAKQAGVKGHQEIYHIENADDRVPIETVDRVLKALNSTKHVSDFEVNLQESETSWGPNPYKGLQSYDLSDAHVFFGRDQFVHDALRSLSEKSILFVAGPSGVGKSSAVKAGLLPKLMNERYAKVVSFRPGFRPMDELSAGIKKVSRESLKENVSDISKQLKIDARLFFFNLQADTEDDEAIIIVIDQFEEVFSSKCDSDQANDLLSVLCNLSHGLQPNDWRIKVVVTFRADFFPRLTANRKLNKVINQEKLLSLAAMTEDELKQAISRPATIAGRKISTQLQDLIVNDLKQGGGLPLMAFCLHALWDYDTSDTIGVRQYRRYGGVQSAISKQAELVYEDQTAVGKNAIKLLFTRLVTVSGGDEPGLTMRSRVLEASLLPAGIDNILVDRLIDARLLTANYSEETDETTLELVHEAIIYGWDRLSTWLEEDREFISWQQEAEQSHKLWVSRDRAAHMLLTGELLANGKQWIQLRESELTNELRNYVKTSLQSHDQKKAIEANSKLELILESEASRLVSRIEEAKRLGFLTPKYLRPIINKAKNLTGVWKLQLASLTYDKTAIRHLLPYLDTCAPDEIGPICIILKPIATELNLNQELSIEDAELTDDVFVRRAAAQVLIFDDTECAIFDAKRVAKIVACQNPLLVRDYVLAFRNAREKLFEPLSDIIKDQHLEAATKDTAALMLFDLFVDQPTAIAKILGYTSLQTYKVALERLITHGPSREKLIAAITHELDTNLHSLGPNSLLKSVQATARLAATLAKFGYIDQSSKVLNQNLNIDVKSQYAVKLKKVGTDPNEVAEAFVAEQDPERLYWLGIALGEFQKNDFERLTGYGLINCIAERYQTDSNASTHSMCGWLLQHYGNSLEKEAIDIQTATDEFDVNREWVNLNSPVGRQQYVLIEPGDFVRGAPATESGYAAYEGPQISSSVTNKLAVAIQGVTVGEFKTYCSANPQSTMPLNISPFSKDDKHPIISITWHEAKDYCEWLSSALFPKSHRLMNGFVKQPKVRLPNEDEWEFFCRAGSNTPFSFGTDVELLSKFAWYQENSGFKTQPYCQLRPNPWGLFDVHGNCWEWCLNPYEHYEGSENIVKLEGDEDLRPLKGGGWNLHHRYCRSACRNWHNAINRNYYTGMRYVIEV